VKRVSGADRWVITTPKAFGEEQVAWTAQAASTKKRRAEALGLMGAGEKGWTGW